MSLYEDDDSEKNIFYLTEEEYKIVVNVCEHFIKYANDKKWLCIEKQKLFSYLNETIGSSSNRAPFTIVHLPMEFFIAFYKKVSNTPFIVMNETIYILQNITNDNVAAEAPKFALRAPTSQ
jgi:hypothetical protein